MNILCILKIHKPVKADGKDMFGYSYVWQKTYCARCGKRL